MQTIQIQQLLKDVHQLRYSGKLDMALENVEAALKIAEGSQQPEFVLESLIELGALWVAKAKYGRLEVFWSNALAALERAERLAQAHRPLETSHNGDLLLWLAEAHSHQKNYEVAKDYLHRAIEVFMVRLDHAGMYRAYTALGQVHYQAEEYDEALDCAHKTISYCNLADNKQLLSASYSQLGLIEMRKSVQPKNAAYFERVLTICEQQENVEAELQALNNLAIIKATFSRYKEAMEYFMRSLARSEEVGHRVNVANCLINIGTIYAHLYNLEEARKRYLAVIDHYQDALELRSQVIVLNNLGNLYFSNGQYELAERYFFKALLIASEQDDEKMLSLVFAQLSRTFFALQRFEEAEIYAFNAADLLQQIHTFNEADHINAFNLARLFFHQKQYEKAIHAAQHGIEAAQHFNDLAYLADGYQLLSSIYEATNQPLKALRYYKQFADFQAQQNTELRSRYTADMEIQVALHHKEQRIEHLTRENHLQSLLLDQKKQIEQQNDRLLAMNEDLRQFAYVVSHDLREPLRMVDAYAQLLDRAYKPALDQTAQTYLAFIREGAKRMSAMMTDLLNYATLNTQATELQVVDTGEAIAAVLQHLQLKIFENRAVVHLPDAMPLVMGSLPMLIQLFQNLLSNAIKFRHKDKNPVIEISYTQNDAHYEFSVRDNGIGIPQHALKRIFEIFQRLHTRKEYEGTGIGLAICQKIVSRLGGNIWVLSEEGVFTDFHFTVGMAKP